MDVRVQTQAGRECTDWIPPDNDLTPFVRPEHYIRHIEPLEADLARQVEYDMDEQGAWLQSGRGTKLTHPQTKNFWTR